MRKAKNMADYARACVHPAPVATSGLRSHRGSELRDHFTKTNDFKKSYL